MILKNLKRGELRPGDILVWASGVDLIISGECVLIVSVVISGTDVYYVYFELGAQELWSSSNYHVNDPCIFVIIRAEP